MFKEFVKILSENFSTFCLMLKVILDLNPAQYVAKALISLQSLGNFDCFQTQVTKKY